MTLPFGELSRLVDGRRSLPELLVGTPNRDANAVVEALVWLERHGFVAPGWVTGQAPLRWRGQPLTDSEAKLLRLLEARLEALFEVSAQFDGPLPVFAGFLRQRETVQRDIVSGRGVARRQAVLSCLGEAAERISARYYGDEPLQRASFASLGDAALHPERLLNVSETQYAARSAWNAREPSDSWIPERFAEDRAVGWVTARSLTGGPERLVPAAYVYFDYPGESDAPCFCVANSNGCASADSIETAVERGFLELVERDAVAIWWYNRLRRPAVAPELLEQTAIAAVAGWQAERQRVLHVLDLTSDLAVPVCAAVSHDRDGGRIVFGFGAAWQREAAALAAVTEMQQVYLSALLIEEAQSKEAQERPSAAARALHRWLGDARLDGHPYLLPGPDASTAKVQCRDSAVSALDRIAALCEDRGLEALVVDLTRHDIGVPAVRVIVPGLRHFWARFGPGRLYEVPVALGWRRRLCPEADLNPTALFI